TLRAEYGRAVEQLATLTCVPDVDPWIIVTRGRARLLEGDRDGANEDFACVLASTEPGQPMAIAGARNARALAAYYLGRYDEVVALLTELAAERESPFDTFAGLALAELGRGNLEAADTWMDEAHRAIRVPRHLIDLHAELGLARHRLAGDGDASV